MYQKEERVGIIVYLYYNRDVKKVAAFGDIDYQRSFCPIPEYDKHELFLQTFPVPASSASLPLAFLVHRAEDTDVF